MEEKQEIVELKSQLKKLLKIEAELSSSQDKLRNQIAIVKQGVAELEVEKLLADGVYAQIVCPSCRGTGETYSIGLDNSDYINEACDVCDSKGYFLARIFEGRRVYTTEELKQHEIYKDSSLLYDAGF